MPSRKDIPPIDQGKEPPLEIPTHAMPFWPGMCRLTAVGLVGSDPKVVPIADGTLRASLMINCQSRPPSSKPKGTKQEYTPVRIECYGELAVYIRNSCSRHDLVLAEGRLVHSATNGYRLRASHFMVLHYHKKGFNTRMIYIRRILWDHVWSWAVKAGMDPKNPLKWFRFPGKTESEAPRDEPERNSQPPSGVPRNPEGEEQREGDRGRPVDPEEG